MRVWHEHLDTKGANDC